MGVSGDGNPDVIYDPTTGDVKFVKDGYAGTVVEIYLHSEGNNFNTANFNTSTGATATPNTLDVQGPGFTGYDFGNVLPAGLSAQQVFSDMTTYTGNNDTFGLGTPGMYINGDGNEHFYDIIAGVPEPTGLALAGVAAVGLLSRKRRLARRGI